MIFGLSKFMEQFVVYSEKEPFFLICNFRKNSGHESNIFSSINLKVKCERIWKGIILYAKSFLLYKRFKIY